MVRRIIGAGFARSALMACLGTTFIAVAVWFFASPIISDLQTGHATLMTTTRTHITWSHAYGLREHPVYFSVKLLTDASNIGTVWAVGCLFTFVLHMLLLLFPYLLKAGIFL